ncbi:lateral signaling target protein 2 homolog [Diadema antillarum]|uniref:lateral signaling target protein 2 homolog n=1 Tax=Diadema antillarum TaxID=105358 RepID=UPI003A8898BA
MLAFRKWFYKPKRNDSQLLAQFYYADDDLNTVSHELDSFDGRQDPDRCTLLVNQLRICQDRVLAIIEQLLNEAIPEHRASRDFRAKFPDDVLQDSLAGQLWFGAECLAAGSTIMNREIESAALRPLARCLTRSLDTLRTILREQSYKNISTYPPKVKDALKKFDHVFAEFELSYVSAMVPVKLAHEYDTMQDVIVLFCETINRALANKLLSQDQIDDYDPGLMFTIPRLAIVSGLVIYPDGPLNMMKPSAHISELFRPFQNLLIKIRELLETLSSEEVHLLERALCSSEESWEDIERQLNQLSFRDRPLTSIDGGSNDTESCNLSPCSSCETESDRICSSGQSLTPESRPCLDSSVRRKCSTHSNQGSLDNVNNVNVPGMVNDGYTQSTAIQIKKCAKKDGFAFSPQMSPDSLEGSATGSRECVQKRRHSSQPSDLSLEDSGHFQGGSPTSRSMDSSPQLGKRRVKRGAMRERAASDNSSLSPDRVAVLSTTDAQVLRREDSGLGSAPNGDLMELYIQEMSSYEPYRDDSETGSHDDTTPYVSPRQGSFTPSQQLLSEMSEGRVLVDDQGHELIVPMSAKEVNPLKSAIPSNASRITMDFRSNFPMFGKGKPSTELNTTGTVGNTVNKIVGEGNQPDRHETLAPNRHSDSSLSLDQSSRHADDETGIPQQGTVRPSRSEPSFRFSLLGSHSQTSHSRDHPSSAINRVTGSRGIVRQPPTSGSDGEESSDLSSSTSSCSSCCSSGSEFEDRDTDYKWESDDSSETNSLISESNDEQEITMAIQAAELAARQQVRSQFRSSSDLVHRLFVCIAGVADQLQTNFASDLRSILKTVFEVTACNPLAADDNVFPAATPAHANPAATSSSLASLPHGAAGSSSGGSGSTHRNWAGEGSRELMGEGRERRRHRSNSSHRSRRSTIDDPPMWIPDEASDECMACRSAFTVIRRKHHCRNCGQIFCARCSANSVPLPRYGQMKPVRVCNRCYMFHVTPFQH